MFNLLVLKNEAINTKASVCLTFKHKQRLSKELLSPNPCVSSGRGRNVRGQTDDADCGSSWARWSPVHVWRPISVHSRYSAPQAIRHRELTLLFVSSDVIAK